MFDGSMQVETGITGAAGGGGVREAWREIDRQFRSLAKRRAVIDHEELALIREASAVAVWRELGMVSIREYLERRMGYTPGVASERVRVAEALDAMPALDHALASGELSFSAVREITRIATRKTEARWLDACRGKTMKEITELLAEREPGDLPESPRKPDLRLKNKIIRMPPHVDAIIRQCRAKLEAEMQRGSGSEHAISPATFERAACDAQWLGNVDAGRTRATQDVTPATRKLVRARDNDRCRVPGCRSARNIDVHHIVHREHGGSHEPSNLVCLCSGHHAAHHDGTLVIRGTADALEVVRPVEPVDTFHVEIPCDKMSEVATFPDRRHARTEDARLHEGRRQPRGARCAGPRRSARPRESDQGRAEAVRPGLIDAASTRPSAAVRGRWPMNAGSRSALMCLGRRAGAHARAAPRAGTERGAYCETGALSAGGTLRLLRMLPLSTLTGTGGVSS